MKTMLYFLATSMIIFYNEVDLNEFHARKRQTCYPTLQH